MNIIFVVAFCVGIGAHGIDGVSFKTDSKVDHGEVNTVGDSHGDISDVVGTEEMDAMVFKANDEHADEVDEEEDESGAVKPRTLHVCEHARNDVMKVTCPPGNVIDIFSASYGRQSTSICQNSKQRVTNCRAITSDKIVKDLCNGRSECFITANNQMFGDPCRGVLKYLEVKYKCKVEGLNGDSRCAFQRGDGIGGSEIKIGDQKGSACVDACLTRKKSDATINGVTVYSDTGKGGCWCERKMSGRNSAANYKSCFITDGASEQTTTFGFGNSNRLSRKGNFLGCIRMEKTYDVTFDFLPTKFDSDVRNVLHLSNGDKDNVKRGDRIPLVSFNPGGHSLYICSDINNNKDYCYTSSKFALLGQWFNIRINQQKYMLDGKYYYTIHLNGQIVFTVMNTHPAIYSNVRVYQSDPWIAQQQGHMKNLVIKTSV